VKEMDGTPFKIIIIGKENVGKTSLLKEFSESFINQKDKIGVEFYKHKINRYGNDYFLQFWDFKADKKFEFLHSKYFEGTNAAILIFDPSDPETFDYCKKELITIRENINNICPFILIANIGNHSEGRGTINRKQYLEFAKNEGATSYVELSENKIKEFREAIYKILDVLIDLKALELFKNDLNLKIIMLLSTYKELSLAEISNYLKKSKATMSRYTRRLIYLGIIKSYTKEDEKTPGSIAKKYYALNKESLYNPEIFTYESFDTSSGKDIMKLRMELRKKVFLLSVYEELNKLLQTFIEDFPKGKQGLTALTFLSLKQSKSSEMYSNIINTILETSMSLHFITEKQYKQLQSLRKDFTEKFDQILENDNDFPKKFIYFETVMPVLRLMNIETPDHKKSLETLKWLTRRFERYL